MTVCEQCRPMYDKWSANPWANWPQPRWLGDGYGATVEGVRDFMASENKRRIDTRKKALKDIREWCAQGKHQKTPS